MNHYLIHMFKMNRIHDHVENEEAKKLIIEEKLFVLKNIEQDLTKARTVKEYYGCLKMLEVLAWQLNIHFPFEYEKYNKINYIISKDEFNNFIEKCKCVLS